MQIKKRYISLLACFLAVVMVLGMANGFAPNKAEAAQSSSEIKQQLDELKAQKEKIDDRIDELESQVSANASEMEQIVAQKNLIDQEIFALYQQETNINEQITTYGLLIADMQRELDDAEIKLEELNKKNKERIRAMEEGGQLSYWSVLFNANDFSDFLDRLNMVNEIAASDRRRLSEMSALAEEIATSKAQMEMELVGLEESKQELAETQKNLEEKRAEADKLLSDLIATGEEYQALLDEQEQIANDLNEDITEKEEAYDEAKNQEWLSTQVPVYTPDGGNGGTGNEVDGLTWLVPCNYILFTSPFGWRIHPIHGDRRFHNGVDLAGNAGTPIIATRAGVVTVTSYDDVSGYYVTIDHQDGYESKYLHMTHYVVQPGQTVAAGQVVGYMGSTGSSTGNHLHFSIKYNGSHVNPALYINI